MMKLTVCIGRTIPNPQERYSSIKGEIAIETTMDQAFPASLEVEELKYAVRTELAKLLKEECDRAWDNVPEAIRRQV